MPNAPCTVRHACREDVPEILAMIRELADYEKELASVEATEQKLLDTIAFADPAVPSSPTTPQTEPITPTRPARCLILTTDSVSDSSNNNDNNQAGTEVVGMALYFYSYSTWRACAGIYLEDLYVRPAHRGKGFGKRLLVELARETVAMGGGRLEWRVLNWNEPSIQFYRAIGAEPQTEWIGQRVDREALTKLAGMLD
ncbi:acyl-CoA N-acyltransferase [Microdochium trichocladiopsis]|uniref:Acyl-CoA N-acyltransferase n=1 Tax=Microdochium trichocladiopsis TaxID=1682393 RepID=A0A9P8YFE3_9PEZI|nr:acyl-CoA N-acyltransferase [Microdochium trichocladiopsis]KAH7035951.1 acyl-CoA N-acyltransferase [Microdochium trichocladiopsis]